jgi:hypothetical protein
MNKELVEKLKNKDYVREFGRMSKEEQELYKKVGARNCVRYSSVLRICGWYDAFDFNEHFSYAIKSNYQPEPEYEDVEIQNWALSGKLGYLDTKLNKFIPLHEIPSMPNFRGFISCGVEIPMEEVAGALDPKTKVIARMIKE